MASCSTTSTASPSSGSTPGTRPSSSGSWTACAGELEASGLAHSEVLLSYLKIFLVKSARLKLEQRDHARTTAVRKPAVLEELRRLIEEDYRTEHSPSYYARRLHLAPKSLAKLVKKHFHKTPTELIRETILGGRSGSCSTP